MFATKYFTTDIFTHVVAPGVLKTVSAYRNHHILYDQIIVSIIFDHYLIH